MNRRITQVALAAAAAMTISLASPVTANATEAAPAKRGSSDTSLSAAKAAPSAAAGSVRLTTAGVITSSSSVYAKTRVAVSSPGARSWFVRADVFVNGVARARQQIVGSNSYPTSSVSWPRSSGYGKVQLRNVNVTSYFDAAPYSSVNRIGDSNVGAVRRGTTYRIGTSIIKRGSKVTVKATKWRVYQPNGKTVAVRKLVVKRAVKGKWRKVKVIKLNKKGNGKVSFKSKKKYKYRVYLNTTSTIQGTYMYWPRKY